MSTSLEKRGSAAPEACAPTQVAPSLPNHLAGRPYRRAEAARQKLHLATATPFASTTPENTVASHSVTAHMKRNIQKNRCDMRGFPSIDPIHQPQEAVQYTKLNCAHNLHPCVLRSPPTNFQVNAEQVPSE